MDKYFIVSVMVICCWSSILFYGVFQLEFLLIVSQIMTSPISSQYPHIEESRTAHQILLTNHLAQSLTTINLNRLNKSITPPHTHTPHLKKQDFLYVCVHGIPPLPNEFQNLNLPGQRLEHQYSAFNPDIQHEEYYEYSFQEEADTLHQKILQKSTTKPIVFVYHSFGTFIATLYFKTYSHERIVGMIDIGGAPIRFYPVIRGIVEYIDSYKMEDLKSKMDDLYAEYAKTGLPLSRFPQAIKRKYTKRQLWSFFIVYKKYAAFEHMFQSVRRWPKVLKCFIYGRRDYLFTPQRLNQKAVYYCYQTQFDQHYEMRLKSAWKEVYGQVSQNVQQRFIFNIETGAHSLHAQKKQMGTVRKIIGEYLLFLETALNPTQIKL